MLCSTQSGRRATARSLSLTSSNVRDRLLSPRHSTSLTRSSAAFQILSTQQGAQGILGTASKQELENEFGTSRDDECIEQILEKGKPEHADAIRGNDWGSTNDSKGSHIDTRGSGRGTSGAGGR